MPIEAGYTAILPIAQTIVYVVVGKKALQPLPVLSYPIQNYLNSFVYITYNSFKL